jgi:hypothetical protein
MKTLLTLFVLFFSSSVVAKVLHLECSNIDRVFQTKLTNYWEIDFDNEKALLKSRGLKVNYLIRDSDSKSYINIYREFRYSVDEILSFYEMKMLAEVLTDPYWKEHSFEFLLKNNLWSSQSELRMDNESEIVIQDCIDLSSSEFKNIQAEYME